MTPSDGVAIFDRAFRELLGRQTDPLIEQLRVIVATKPLRHAGAVGFCQEANWESFPVWTYVLDISLRKELLDDRPYDSLPLKNAGILLWEDAIDSSVWDACGDVGIDLYSRGAELLFPWFADCWLQAGGANFALPAFIQHHDAERYYDLQTKRYVQELEELSNPSAA